MKGSRDKRKAEVVTFLQIKMFTNFGRDIVFSADLCYNGADKK